MAKKITLVTIQSGQHYSEPNLTNNYTNINNNFDNFLHLNGVGESSNTMLGNLDMGGLRILNVSAPSLSFDVATKAYVDAASLLAATGTIVGSEVDDTDGDTGIQAEATADLDRLDLFAATSGGADNALEIIGDDGTASSLGNPYVKILKHIMLDTDVRIGDAAGAASNTWIELSDQANPDVIGFTAGGNLVWHMTSTAHHAHQDIIMHDDGATAAGKTIGDEDGDTYIQFNQATGGTDDDIIRFYANGSQILTVGASGLSDLIAVRIENLGIGIDLPGVSENHNIIVFTGTANAAADLQDNTVAVYSSVVSGIENELRIDVKRTGPVLATVILGYDSIFPNDVTITGDLTISSTTASSSKDTGALVVEGGVGVEEDVYVGGTVNIVGTLVFNGATFATDIITEKTATAGVTIDGFKIKDTAPDPTVWPCFRVYMNSSDQTISSSSPTKVEFNGETFDTNSDFDSSTNYRFTPTIAGYYKLNSQLELGGTSGTEIYTISIYKNGSVYSSAFIPTVIDSGGLARPAPVSDIIHANGTTDYFEIFIDSTADTSYTIYNGTTVSYWSGSRIA